MKRCDGPADLEEVVFVCFNCNLNGGEKRKEEARSATPAHSRHAAAAAADRLLSTGLNPTPHQTTIWFRGSDSIHITNSPTHSHTAGIRPLQSSGQQQDAKPRNTAADGCPHMPKKTKHPQHRHRCFPSPHHRITDHAQTLRATVSNLRTCAATTRANFTKR